MSWNDLKVSVGLTQNSVVSVTFPYVLTFSPNQTMHYTRVFPSAQNVTQCLMERDIDLFYQYGNLIQLLQHRCPQNCQAVKMKEPRRLWDYRAMMCAWFGYSSNLSPSSISPHHKWRLKYHLVLLNLHTLHCAVEYHSIYALPPIIVPSMRFTTRLMELFDVCFTGKRYSSWLHASLLFLGLQWRSTYTSSSNSPFWLLFDSRSGWR